MYRAGQREAGVLAANRQPAILDVHATIQRPLLEGRFRQKEPEHSGKHYHFRRPASYLAPGLRRRPPEQPARSLHIQSMKNLQVRSCGAGRGGINATAAFDKLKRQERNSWHRQMSSTSVTTTSRRRSWSHCNQSWLIFGRPGAPPAGLSPLQLRSWLL